MIRFLKNNIPNILWIIFISYFGFSLISNILIKNLNKFTLLKYGVTTKGYINQIEEEYIDSETSRNEFEFYYGYEFIKNGVKYNGGGSGRGRIPEKFENAERKPIQIDILYMETDPTINIYKADLPKSNWFIYRSVISILFILIIAVYLVWIIAIKSRLKN